MPAILRISIIVAAIAALPSRALREHGTGVCTKTETTVVMDTETFMESYAVRYETCTLLVFCKTKYRLGYRSKSRSVYKTVENELLTCCSGYSEVDNECKLKAPVTIPSPSTPTISPAFLSFSTSYFSLSEERATEEVSTIFSNFQFESDPLPVTTTMMISGILVIFIIAGIISLVLIVFVLKRRKRTRFQAASSPLQREGRGNGQEPQVQYYAVIPESSAQASGVVIGSPPLNASPPTVSKQSTKKKNKLRKEPLSMKKNSLGVKMSTDSIQDEQDVSNRLLSEDVSHYTDMDHPESSPSLPGYIDMQSPKAQKAQSMGYTYMGQNSEGYSEMNTQEKRDEDVPQSSECEGYDILNLSKRPPMEDNCYDKLDRSSDLLWGSAVTNNYDMENNHEQIGSTQNEDSSEVQQESNTHVHQENLYSYPQNNGVLDSTGEHNNVKEVQYINSRCKESEPTYYNNTEETTQLPKDLNDASIYTNVS